jgi:hypothetical protein
MYVKREIREALKRIIEARFPIKELEIDIFGDISYISELSTAYPCIILAVSIYSY